MKKVLGTLIVLALIAIPASAQKITIDYAHDFDFGSVKTFQYRETEGSDTGSDLMSSRIRDAIINELTEGGLTEVDAEPDIFIVYHVTSKESTVYNTSTSGYGGYYGGWGGYGRYGYGGVGVGSSTTTATTFTDGTLIIDAYEPDEKTMIWRGTGTVTVASKPQKQAKQIDEILKKMGAKWGKILANQGK